MLDAYSRRARLAPAGLAAAPALVLAGGSLLAIEQTGAIVGFLLAAAAVVLCGLVRSRGRGIEPALWSEWGGAPTTQLMRWSGPSDRHQNGRRHLLLEGILGEALPTPAEESADPVGADRRYETATAALRDLTRDRRRFPLVTEENAEYGLRRNSLGLKPLALRVAFLCAATSIALTLINGGLGRFLVPAAVSVIAIGFWTLVVKSSWVRESGERYAVRLMEAAESLSREDKTRRPGRVSAPAGNGGSDG